MWKLGTGIIIMRGRPVNGTMRQITYYRIRTRVKDEASDGKRSLLQKNHRLATSRRRRNNNNNIKNYISKLWLIEQVAPKYCADTIPAEQLTSDI